MAGLAQLAAAALLVAATSGCITHPDINRGPSEEAIAKVTEGKTKDEVRAILGPPNFVDFNSDGAEKWTYTVSRSQYRGPYTPRRYQISTITILFQGDVVAKIGRGETRI